MEHDTTSPTTRNRESVGWALLGASRVARDFLLPALRAQLRPDAQTETQTEPQVRIHAERNRSKVIGVHSHSSHRGTLFADHNRLARAYESRDELLARSDVDCVYVSSQPHHQYALALAALEADKHVLCETPMGVSLSEATRLERASRNHGVLLVPNFAYRGDAALTRMAEMVRDYTIGTLLGGQIINCTPLPADLQTWRLQSEGGGVVLDRTIHDIDLVRWLFADEIEQVTALASRRVLGPDVDDEVVVNLRLRRGGQLVQCHDSFVTPHRFSSVELYGTRGSLRVHHWWSREQASELLLVRNHKVDVIPTDTSDRYVATVNAFHQALQSLENGTSHTNFLASSSDGVRNLQVALAVQDSIRDGWSVRIE